MGRGNTRHTQRRRWVCALALVAVASVMTVITPSDTPAAEASSGVLLRSEVEATLEFVADQARDMVDELPSTISFPRSTTSGGSWITVNASDWVSGFWPALLWQLYSYTDDADFLAAATAWSSSLPAQATRTDTHDVGFMVGLPASIAYEATGSTTYRDLIITSARSLATRYDPDVGATKSWDFGPWQFPVIVDNVVNVDFLAIGAGLTPSSTERTSWRAIAGSHASVTAAQHMRNDGSTFHLVDFNPTTGAVISRGTHAGADDDTTWARGQAWALYGFTSLAATVGGQSNIDAAVELADYFLDNLPADNVPYWDFDAPGIPSTAKDASAAAIAASGLLELSTLTSGSESDKFFDGATDILTSLMSPAYLSNGSNSDGVVLHVTGFYPQGTEIDVSTIYADYFFTEALLRYLDIAPAADEDPTVSVATPSAGAEIPSPVAITGSAADDIAVSQVLVSIQEQATGRYWNGSGFQSAATSVAATLSSPGAASTGWSYSFDLGTSPPSSQPYALSVTALDSSGQQSTASTRTFRVEDVVPPLITLIGDNPQSLPVGSPYVELGSIATDDVDGDLSQFIVVDISSVDMSSVGTYTVTYSVSDSSGNGSSTVRSLKVVDATAPSITLADPNPVVLNLGEPYVEPGATASDDVDGDITADISIDSSGVNDGAPGGYRVTYNVSDDAGNQAPEQVRAVLVVGAGAPAMALFGATPQTITVGEPYVELGATAWDDIDGDLTSAIAIDATDVDTSKVGSYEVLYDVEDSDFNAAPRIVRSVLVIDDVAPVITLVGPNPQSIDIRQPYVELGARATDNVDGDLSAEIAINSSSVNTNRSGAYLVTYDVTDAAGNAAATVTRTVTVGSDLGPEITMRGPSPQRIPFGGSYTEYGATAEDAQDGDLTASVMTDASDVDTTRPGVYRTVYSVTDSGGNRTVATRQVEVVDFFVDDDNSIFQRDINGIALAGITRGCNPPRNDWYCEEGNVTRGQFAAMITRALGLPATSLDPFGDDNDSIFEDDINRLYAAGITRGCNPPTKTKYCPDRFLTRGEAAAMFVRALGYSDNGGGDIFDDDDTSVFEDDIDKLATAGVTRGCNPPANTRFCPTRFITRGQIAAFLARALGL